ncbi:hypothetical protein I302_105984 [Kwoniella bestiolae CBS 10118]|uniref:Myb-like domain-containing protein n=1 Tax=Kwoniella bestiolae CBS 10118 TaxID=1296100 RepID=A0A1B9G2P5_9TREE|nr:hypothetical protein I302_05108 [Kwoniella bestiolae CBS 10118]OCF25294.1 hypothetical protein I302_05108 [Kwoniella bestiolae CBS 10118]
MPPKREQLSSSPERDLKPFIEKKKKVAGSPSKTKTSWTTTEEIKFRDGINAIVKKHLWNELKNDPELVKRGSNGVAQHWIAMYKKM